MRLGHFGCPPWPFEASLRGKTLAKRGSFGRPIVQQPLGEVPAPPMLPEISASRTAESMSSSFEGF